MMRTAVFALSVAGALSACQSHYSAFTAACDVASTENYHDLFCVDATCSAALAAMSTGCDAVVASEAKHKARADSYLGYCRNPVSVITRASGDSCSSVRSRSAREGLLRSVARGLPRSSV